MRGAFGEGKMRGVVDAQRLLRHVGDVAGVAGIFFEAAMTERKMPGVLRKRYRVAWPEYLPDPQLAYGYNQAEVRLGAASPDEVWRYDFALELTQTLDADDARLVWACAHSAVRRQRGPAWTRIARTLGMRPETVRRKFERAMVQVYYALKARARGLQSAS